MRVWAAAVVIAGCGRIGFDARPDGAPPDLAVAPACGTSVVFTDELDDTTAGPLFTPNTDPGISLVEGGGHLDINFITRRRTVPRPSTFRRSRTRCQTFASSPRFRWFRRARHFWRLRHQNNTMYFDASEDGIVFIELWAFPNLFVATSAQGLLGAGASGGTTLSSFARFESVRATGP